VKKNYHTSTTSAATPRPTMAKTTISSAVANPTAPSCEQAELAVSDSLAITLVELAESAQEGLLALAVGTGLQVMDAMMEQDVFALAGPKGRWNPDRVATRHGTDDGQVTLGGRRLAVRRPRVRSADGAAELAIPSYELFSSTEILGRMALERMMAKLSTGVPPVGRTLGHAASRLLQSSSNSSGGIYPRGL
jgi:putative transposase